MAPQESCDDCHVLGEHARGHRQAKGENWCGGTAGLPPDGTGEWCWGKGDRCSTIDGFPQDGSRSLCGAGAFRPSAHCRLVGDGDAMKAISSLAASKVSGLESSSSVSPQLSRGGESIGTRLD